MPIILKSKGLINPMNEGIITSSFGERKNPLTGKSEFHNGIDIAAEEGTKVVAVGNGRVTEIGESSSYGNYIKYEIDEGIIVMYAHLKTVYAEEGDFVTQGQEIAEEGSTGNSTGPHLHYTIYKDGAEINPMVYVNYEATSEVYAEYSARGQAYG